MVSECCHGDEDEEKGISSPGSSLRKRRGGGDTKRGGGGEGGVASRVGVGVDALTALRLGGFGSARPGCRFVGRGGERGRSMVSIEGRGLQSRAIKVVGVRSRV